VTLSSVVVVGDEGVPAGWDGVATVFAAWEGVPADPATRGRPRQWTGGGGADRTHRQNRAVLTIGTEPNSRSGVEGLREHTFCVFGPKKRTCMVRKRGCA